MLERTHFTIERTHSIQNTFYMCAGGSINNRRKPGGRSFSFAASPCLNGVSPPLPPPPAVAPSIHLIRRFASNKAFLLLPLLLPPPSLPPPSSPPPPPPPPHHRVRRACRPTGICTLSSSRTRSRALVRVCAYKRKRVPAHTSNQS
jgi:hypothetical protein